MVPVRMEVDVNGKIPNSVVQGNEDLIPHTFFHHRLPDGETPSSKAFHSNMITLVRSAIQDYDTKYNSNSPIMEKSDLSKLVTMFDNWNQFESSNPALSIQKSIELLQLPGDMLALHIEMQNAGFILTVDNNNELVVSTFQASCKSEEVMSGHSLWVDYPTKSITVPQSKLLKSPAFAEALVTLANDSFVVATPTARKAGHSFGETWDVKNPLLIQEWVTNLLSDQSSNTSHTFPRIRKKVRDDVILGQGARLPFRRSGAWMTVKVAMQLCLLKSLARPEDAVFVYKCVMLLVFLLQCKAYYKTNRNKLELTSVDLLVQMMRKVGRRQAKLTDYARKYLPEFDSSKTPLQPMVLHTLKEINAGLTSAWKTHIKNLSDTQRVPVVIRSLNNRTKDMSMLQHVNSSLLAAIQKQNVHLKECKPTAQSSKPTPSVPECPKRTSMAQIPTIVSKSDPPHVMDTYLVDVENWVRLYLPNFEEPSAIQNLLQAYNQCAESHYSGDPLGRSNANLTVLKGIKVLDEIAVKRHPLYASHDPGINTDELLPYLLVPLRTGMEYVTELKTYFERRVCQASLPSIIDEKVPNSKSFSVRFARESEDMMELRKTILMDCGKKQDAKKEEVCLVREQCLELDAQIKATENHDQEFDKYYECDKCISTCVKCGLEKRLESFRKSVRPYEKLLCTDNEDRQFAVVFELRLPEVIGVLREMLHLLNHQILNKPPLIESSSGVVGEWVSSSFVNQYARNHHRREVRLVSTAAATLASHLGRQNTPDVLFTYNDEEWIKNNGYNYVYHCSRSRGRDQECPKTVCTFQIPNSSVKFKGMQWALNSTDHGSNEVLARQNECPGDLSIPEFIQFGSFRAGSKLQLRNLLLSLTNGHLSFKDEEVVMLLCQSMWQLGKEFGTMCQDHQDLLDDNFTAGLLAVLGDQVENVQDKWSEPYVLCSLTLISVRIFEISNLQGEAGRILRRCRTIAHSWNLRLKDLDGGDKAIGKTTLKRNRVVSALTTVITFAPTREGLPLMTEDLTVWMTAMSILYNDIFSNRFDDLDGFSTMRAYREMFFNRMVASEVSSTMLRSLQRLAISTAVNLQPQIEEVIKSSEGCLDTYLHSSWREFRERRVGWERIKGQLYACPQVANHRGEIHHVYIDTLFGRFLVDGYPIGKLPEVVLYDKTFQRTFGGMDLLVQPSDLGAMGKAFTTSSDLKGFVYRFIPPSRNSSNIVIEETYKARTLQLLSHEYVASSKTFPTAFIETFSHWWDPTCDLVYFRPKHFQQFSNAGEPEYVWDLKTGFLHDTLTGRQLLSTTDWLTAPFIRVEDKALIHTWQDTQLRNAADLELTGLSLSFTLTHGIFYSRDFPGMFVDQCQNLGTLVGLENKLVLKERLKNGLDPGRLVIVPNRLVKPSIGIGNQHQTVPTEQRSKEEQRTPLYFVYRVNKYKQCLDAGKSQLAWLHLALLHATTSSPLPDPFTWMTGVEMCMRILNSPYVWSNQGYGAPCMTILSRIEQLSPTRCFLTERQKCQQRIQWPSGVSTVCANEGYKLQVDALRQQSRQLGETKFMIHDKMVLNVRHYWRQAGLENPGTFPTLDLPKPVKTVVTPPPDEKVSSHLNVRMISYLCENWTSTRCDYASIRRLLWTSEGLQLHQRPQSDTRSYTSKQLKSAAIRFPKFSTELETTARRIRDNWLYMFRVAKAVGKQEQETGWRQRWNLTLSSLAFFGVDINILLTFHLVSVNAAAFSKLEIPTADSLSCPTASFNLDEITTAVNRCAETFYASYSTYPTHAEQQRARQANAAAVSLEVATIVNAIQNQWKPREVKRVSLTPLREQISKINLDRAKKEVNVLISKWYNNSKFEEFLGNFETVCASVMSNSQTIPDLSGITVPQTNFVRFAVPTRNLHNLVEVIQRWDTNGQAFEKADAVYKQTAEDGQDEEEYAAPHFQTQDEFVEACQKFKTLTSAFMDQLGKLWHSDGSSHTLIEVGLYPRYVPLVLLPLLLLKQSGETLQRVQSLIGATAVCWTLQQKMSRCVRFKQMEESMKIALEREEETKGLKSWSPKDYPTWLILELEMNVTIRPQQVQIAKNMLDPTTGKNSVLQLNMGEGKTALIVPMLVSLIANGVQLCRVTVIKPIFETNVAYLRQVLGGLLNRRVYTFPFDRCSTLAPASIGDSLKQCLRLQGVHVTLPEYRLSLKLKGLELAKKGDGGALPFLDLQDWLDENARDILDESDDILSVKYQLIYTVGDQVPVSGGNLRWEVAQRILKIIPQIMCELKDTYGDSAIEYISEYPGDTSIFWNTRILDPSVAPELIDKIAEKFLHHGLIDFADFGDIETRENVKKFLTDNTITDEEIQAVRSLEVLATSGRDQDVLLIMAGYLRFGILETTLTGKRWRVNFGVNPKGIRKMAVPFRAKDVASERTEFGHVDVAILLTHLSYYYSGLTDAQILECFAFLETNRKLNPSDEYLRWIMEVPLEKVHDSVRTYAGVNLSDSSQRNDHLFPILRRSMNVINFWLSNFVLPKECRQFEGKLTCTAWDLVPESMAKLTTGFSGTNGTKDTLPSTISQNDLQEFVETNDKVEAILLQKENDYTRFPLDVTAERILQYLKEKGIKVLLDCGALMLQLDNKGVADKWLDVDSSLKAVVFFNERNELTVQDRALRSRDSPFELSPFKDKLEDVGVYLDDEHTRGTDLRFPLHSRAAVTLGSGLTRDKLVQACMRMRQLGKGQSVTFWASHDVHNAIASHNVHSSEQLTGWHVLEWVKANSRSFVENGMVFWTRAAVNYCQKRAAEDIYKTSRDIRSLGAGCSENEVLKLEEMYSHAREERLFLDIYPEWFTRRKLYLQNVFKGGSATNTAVRAVFQPQEDTCRDRLASIIPNKQHFSQLLDEEQEKELELEEEQETQRQNPPVATQLQHMISQGLKETLKEGEIQGTAHIYNAAQIYRNTSVASILQPTCWGNVAFCTSDFLNTVRIDSATEGQTQFLRPVTWGASIQSANGNLSKYIIVSPYEANALIPAFRGGQFKSVLHMLNPRRILKQSILINNHLFSVPSTTKLTFEWEPWLPPLILTTGFLYFDKEAEMDAYCKFLGIIPKPIDDIFQEFSNAGMISGRNGFVPKENRNFHGCPIPQESFSDNPEHLVTEICRIRNDSTFPEESHVERLVVRGMKSEF